jgi:hypothetical protein
VDSLLSPPNLSKPILAHLPAPGKENSNSKSYSEQAVVFEDHACDKNQNDQPKVHVAKLKQREGWTLAIDFVLKMVDEFALVDLHSNANGGGLMRLPYDHGKLQILDHGYLC